MSSTQYFANTSTGLREIEAQMGSLRGLNGTLVSALTAVMGPSNTSYARRYETGSTEGIKRLLRAARISLLVFATN